VTADHFLRDSSAERRPDGATPSQGSDFVGCSFDYDLYNRESSGDSVGPSLGRHLIHGEPQWRTGHGARSGAVGRFQLASEAAGRNAGVALANYNQGRNDEGGAPDIGAHESGAPDMIFGPAAQWLVP
jgi:hypothetical protein